MGSPCNAVNASPVVVETRHRGAWDPYVQDDDLAGVHGDRGQIVGVLLVPGQP